MSTATAPASPPTSAPAAAVASAATPVPRQRTTPSTSPGRRGAPPRLQVVRAPAGRRRTVPFVAVVAALLASTLVALLMLNIALSRGAFTVHELERRSDLLAEEQQALAERLAVEASPARLAERAAGLGMVPNENPAGLRLEDGAVLGTPAPAAPPAVAP
ncbi:hypothetical protein ACFP6A_06450 [Quadrisphaera sp. GCM10027208]|uniref:hypothetical protein n=1 Tax=Quadrisphaera sp. GCM10027208 TaxID=3273423 RepID=UPI00360B30B6|nr:hypothetical protein HJG43_04905 [Kineosporiaceae bacterium SCSIO 59966]